MDDYALFQELQLDRGPALKNILSYPDFQRALKVRSR